MKKVIGLSFVLILFMGGTVFAVSPDFEIPGYLNVKGVTTLEGKVTATGGIKATGTVEATTFSGSGVGLTDIQADIIAAGAVTSSAISDEAVTSSKISNEAVTSTKIAPDAVTTDKIAPNTITGADMATDIAFTTTGLVTVGAIYGDGSNLGGVLSDAVLSAHLNDTATHGATGAVVGTTNTQTLTNKTLTAPKIGTEISLETSGADYTLVWSEPAANRTLTIQSLTADDDFVFASASATLANKILSSPVVNTPSISNGTITDTTLSLNSTIETTGSTGIQFNDWVDKWAFKYDNSLLGGAVHDTGLYFSTAGRAEWRYLNNVIWYLDVVSPALGTAARINANAGITATTTESVPLIVNNSTGTQNIMEVQDDGTSVLTVADGGAVAVKVNLQLEDPGAGTNTVTLQAPDLTGGGYTLTLPQDDGSTGQSLITDGNGVLSWGSGGSGVTQINQGLGILMSPSPITTTGIISIDSTVVTTLTGTQTLTNKTLTSPAINTPSITGGTINNTPIGGTTRNTGNFTVLNANGNVTLGDAAADTVTINGNATVPTGTTFTVTDNAALRVGAASPNIVLLGTGTSQLFIQSGTSTTLAVTFPRAFAAATTPTVIITPGVATGNLNNYVTGVSNTGFTAAGGLGGGDTFYWIAIGVK